MSTWVVITSIVAALFAAALGILLIRMLSYRRRPTGENALSDFSLSRYQVMTELISGEDVQFFSGQKGITRSQYRRFKHNRRRIFRLYLRELTADFHVLHGQAREMVADAPKENSHLVGSLFRLQMDFWRFLTMIEVQLVMDRLGLGTVDSRRLLETMNLLQASLAGSSAGSGPVMV